MKKLWICLLAIFLSGCGSADSRPTPSVPLKIPTVSPMVTITPAGESDLSVYAYPASIDPAKRYLFYLHGKITEDQGLHAISPDYGAYEYEAILKKLASYGFVVISEQREKNADARKHAARVEGQVTELLNAGTPPQNITIVGASKGAHIAVFASDLLKNPQMNFVLLGTCHPDNIKEWKQSRILFYGNVLAIYDSADQYAGSCDEMFATSTGIRRHEEIVLRIGAGHGILYQPLDEWIIPAVRWAE